MSAVGPPLLVTGPARSGTTLVARMLSAHPRVQVAVDPLFPLVKAIRNALIRDVRPALDPAAPLQDDHGSAAGAARLAATVAGTLDVPVDAAALDAVRSAIGRRCGIESPDLVDLAEGVRGATYAEILTRFLAGVAARRGAPAGAVVGLKEVWAADLVPAWLRAHPDARAILVRRDPRAVLASNLGMARHDPSQVAHPLSVLRHWRRQEAIAAWLAARPGLADRVLVVGYEDLLRDTARVVRGVCDFLGVDDDGSMRDPDRIRDAHGGPFVANSSFGVRSAGLAPELAERWRRTLPPERTTMVEAACGAEMAAVGYAPDGPGGPESLAVLAALVTADHAARWSWRSDLGDPAQDVAVELARHALRTLPDGALPDAVERALFLVPEARRASARPAVTGAAA